MYKNPVGKIKIYKVDGTVQEIENVEYIDIPTKNNDLIYRIAKFKSGYIGKETPKK